MLRCVLVALAAPALAAPTVETVATTLSSGIASGDVLVGAADPAGGSTPELAAASAGLSLFDLTTDAESAVASSIPNVGALAFADVTSDGLPELLVAGDGLDVFANTGGVFLGGSQWVLLPSGAAPAAMLVADMRVPALPRTPRSPPISPRPAPWRSWKVVWPWRATQI